jgi:hypothetical protein
VHFLILLSVAKHPGSMGARNPCAMNLSLEDFLMKAMTLSLKKLLTSTDAPREKIREIVQSDEEFFSAFAQKGTSLHSRNCSWGMAQTVVALPICDRLVSLSLERFQDHLGLVLVPSAVPRPITGVSEMTCFRPVRTRLC